MKTVFVRKSLLFFSIFILNSCTYEKLNEVKKNTIVSPSPVIDDSNVKIVVTPSPIVSVSPSTNLVGVFDIKKASEVVTNKCTYCHSLTPNPSSGRTKAAAGITFDSQSEIESQMDLIKKVTFTTRSMPTGSITMTEDERNVIGLYGTNGVLPSPTPSLIPTPSPIVSVLPSANLVGIFDIKRASEIVTNKCAYCHSTTPNSASGRTKAAAGITFDSQSEIESQMDLIKKVTFTTRSMPTGSITMTEEERNVIGLYGVNEVIVPKKLEIKDAPSIITRKCTYCHSTTPDPDSGYKRAPEGFTLDSVDEMIVHSKDIYEETITKKSMPVGKISITSEERNIISQWISQQKGSTSVSDNSKDDSDSKDEEEKEEEKEYEKEDELDD